MNDKRLTCTMVADITSEWEDTRKILRLPDLTRSTDAEVRVAVERCSTDLKCTPDGEHITEVYTFDLRTLLRAIQSGYLTEAQIATVKFAKTALSLAKCDCCRDHTCLRCRAQHDLISTFPNVFID